jgi:hypothetical protein
VREAARVYDLLLRAVQISAAPPRLMLYDGKKYAAQTFADHRIIMDSRLFDLTRSLGEDSSSALAFILGHELHHAISDDFWCHHISASRAVIDTRTREAIRKTDVTRNPEQQVIAEARADAIGAMYAYLAGFGGEIPVEKILRLIYEEYRPTSAGYPSFTQRLQIIRTTHERVRQLLPLFDAANRCLLIGEYAMAAAVYTRLLHDFPSREVYNNQGVARALRAVDDLPIPPTMAFPFEIDMESRMQARSTRGEDSEHVGRLLSDARESFQEASRRDTGYIIAQLNLACVEALLAEHGDHALALGIASRARKAATRSGDTRTHAAALGVQGLIRVLHGEERAGASLLQEAENTWPGLPFVRRSLISGEASTGSHRTRTDAAYPTVAAEEIAGLNPEHPPSLTPHAMEEGGRIFWAVRSEAEYHCVTFRDLDDDAGDIVMLATAPGYPGSSARGVRIGSPITALRDAYGEADAVLAIPKGTVHRYTGTTNNTILCTLSCEKLT